MPWVAPVHIPHIRQFKSPICLAECLREMGDKRRILEHERQNPKLKIKLKDPGAVTQQRYLLDIFKNQELEAPSHRFLCIPSPLSSFRAYGNGPRFYTCS